jgi:hypothetical protein
MERSVAPDGREFTARKEIFCKTCAQSADKVLQPEEVILNEHGLVIRVKARATCGLAGSSLQEPVSPRTFGRRCYCGEEESGREAGAQEDSQEENLQVEPLLQGLDADFCTFRGGR